MPLHFRSTPNTHTSGLAWFSFAVYGATDLPILHAYLDIFGLEWFLLHVFYLFSYNHTYAKAALLAGSLLLRRRKV